MCKRKLPIAIQTFAKIREADYYYVDKTGIALQLIEQGNCYFLSRPRRFGKSLFLDTLKQLFEGNQKLFTGLAAEKQWDWGVQYPVIRISFSDGVLQSRAQLDEIILDCLRIHRLDLNVPLPTGLPENNIAANFRDLIRQAHQKFGQRAVVLIDEYDKPILDNIDNTPIATEMREGLKNLYSVLKGSDENLKFVFLTGVSKFSKVSLFSGLNNLQDITLDPRYSTICGYTDHDLDTTFAPELVGLDREQVRAWYNGYNWLGDSVYNPYDALLLFSTRTFKAHWFETGTPTFLIKLLAMQPNTIVNLGQSVADSELLSTFDVDAIAIEALMFQAGYLTIASQEMLGEDIIYRLRYPNREVRQGLHNRLLDDLSLERTQKLNNRIQLYHLLQSNDLAGLQTLFHAFYATIPHQWYSKNNLAGLEGYYASIFYSYFAALGLEITLEDTTNHGRIDMTLRFEGRIYIFEFKVVELVPDGRALQQIKDKQYADKYKATGMPIYLIGVEFSKESRNIVGYEVEAVQVSK
jgi:hypothetical protein